MHAVLCSERSRGCRWMRCKEENTARSAHLKILSNSSWRRKESAKRDARGKSQTRFSEWWKFMILMVSFVFLDIHWFSLDFHWFPFISFDIRQISSVEKACLRFSPYVTFSTLLSSSGGARQYFYMPWTRRVLLLTTRPTTSSNSLWAQNWMQKREHCLTNYWTQFTTSLPNDVNFHSLDDFFVRPRKWKLEIRTFHFWYLNRKIKWVFRFNTR